MGLHCFRVGLVEIGVPSKDLLASSPINLVDQKIYPISAVPVHKFCVKEDVGQPSKPEGFSLGDREWKQDPESLQHKEQDKTLREQAGAVGCTGRSAFTKRFHGTSRQGLRISSLSAVLLYTAP